MAYEYKVSGQSVQLQLDPSVVAVRFGPSEPNSSRAMSAEAAGIGPFANRFDIPSENLTIIPAGPGILPSSADQMQKTIETKIGRLNQQAAVDVALPVFNVNGNHVVATDRVIVGIDVPSEAAKLATKYNATVLRDFEKKVVLQIAPGADPFAISNAISGEPGVRFAEPDFITIGRHIPKRSTATANIPLEAMAVPRQYAMKITKAVEAWEIQIGSRNVRIAVLDEGVDTDHPDLKDAVVGTFDATDDDTYQEPNGWDGHGTSCSGLALAAGNVETGVRGTGVGCSLLAVRIAYSQFKGGPWITSNEKIARAIAWARTNEASVISNSWGGGAPSGAIIEEFEAARTEGRNGLGCVIVIAAGNAFGPVQFPAKIPNVLAVSASNEFDQIKTPTSLDGETWWGTCFGPEISVGAPGVHNLTTDISGSDGYDATNYTPSFNGTSSATPIVAGACGLILSANPELTEQEVRTLVMQTADKVGEHPYVDAGRNDFFGFGRLNVLAAITAAQAVA